MKVNKMNNYKVLIQSLILFLFCVVKMNAQELLTIEDAVKIALENNYAIKIAANELTIGKTNVSIGNAGMLPRATASIIDNNNIKPFTNSY
jgi:outer membrane protein TolC